MADHFSGPRILFDPASDVADVFAFPSPDRPGCLVLVLDVFPAAAPTALFSDAITYRFRVRPVAPAADRAAFTFGDTEYGLDFTFATPGRLPGGDDPLQIGTCTTSTGEEVLFLVGGDKPTEAEGLRIFAGPRLDPFFIDLAGVLAADATRKLAFGPGADNVLEGMNVLSIVVEVDPEVVFGLDCGPLLGVVGETVTSGGRPVRLERMGRPEIKNVVLASRSHDLVNRDLEIRDLYNEEDAFSLRPDYVEAYRARFNANLAFFDRLDGELVWPPDDRGTHPLTELLLADFLVVDISKPFAEDSCFEIEAALLAGRPHTTCGGRAPNDDIVDTLYTLLVGGVDGPRISDGVDGATQPATHDFPYLVAPNPNPPDLMTVMTALLAPPEPEAEAA
ncbi:uncharacterized protein DUF4331 [Streptomyces sp. TLI_55]|uniref:DUF4331 family protein n=1 Tax=Streptomyces sp. TLI_55 TaxID=1938861 RepID=UPI000BD8A207|nr:DUF4331 family protein [Streptomyces sp. TLI_55]SNX66303.1 uncharacterized protein DUF4331 [Streptomyces sp. TLI_55]